jgi:hypothetical protein
LSGRKWQRDPSSEVKYFLSAEAMRYKLVSGGKAAGAEELDDPDGPPPYTDDDIPF